MTKQLMTTWAAKRTRLAITILAAILVVTLGTAAMIRAQAIPTISIVSVEEGGSVTIETENYPANQTFTVRMGTMGTRGIDGTVVGTLESGAGGSISATFDIPAALQDDEKVAIRLESAAGYYSYNWFYNVTASVDPGSSDAETDPDSSTGTTVTAYSGIPTFSIMSVTEDGTVTINTRNFPANRDFEVMIGAMGTRGINGTMVATTNSGEGGEFSATYNIPVNLQGAERLAIRLESSGGYYAFNWFFNNTMGDSDVVTRPPAQDPPEPAYEGVPTFTIDAVTRDGSVTILTENLPPNRDFRVTMGPMFTRGVNGTMVATTNSGEGGAQTLTYTIPDELAGSYRIAIRLESGDGYFAYNWFYNSSTD